MKSIIGVMLICIILGACNSTKNVNSSVIVNRQELIVPTARPVVQNDVNWIVLSETDIVEKVQKLKSEGVSVLIALTPEGYKTLNVNIAELRRYISEQKNIIAAYKKYYSQ